MQASVYTCTKPKPKAYDTIWWIVSYCVFLALIRFLKSMF